MSLVEVEAEEVDGTAVAVDASTTTATGALACTDTDTLLVLGPFSRRNTELRTKYEAMEACQVRDGRGEV